MQRWIPTGPRADRRLSWRLLALVPVVGALVAFMCAAPFDSRAGSGPMPRTDRAGSPFDEPFDAWVLERWSRGQHELGRGRLDSLNVGVRQGVLEIATPAGTHHGGEIASTAAYGYGAYTASMRCGTPLGTVCAFFLYESTEDGRSDEIDVEVLGGTRELWLTTWVGGRETNHSRVDLGFDPSAGFHAYSMEYRPGSVSFRVDGVFVRRYTRALPRRPMRLMANAWWPVWREAGSGGGALFIDSIRAEP